MTIEPSLFLYDMLRDTNSSLLPKYISFRNLKYITIKYTYASKYTCCSLTQCKMPNRMLNKYI